ncbi:hypothetical protein RvY_03998 [Ramazzottius varieornatus]|uniref:Flavin-containing monooxygenase n=1 Tax=Ramazzottius varieornatus TaxID=947166 RepID=A0A1D1UQ07_RAMVA|nr:hypothetical protein RvY_03998 [Ramazzottius varieornatus]
MSPAAAMKTVPSMSTTMQPELARPITRICVVGAGLSGLCTLRHFTADPAYKVTAYEQQDRVGGLWNYPEGCENYKNLQDDTSPYFCRMHRNLKTNATKFFMTFAGEPRMTEEMDMFPTPQMVGKYLKTYAEYHGLYNHIKMRHVVKSISPLGDNPQNPKEKQRWKVVVFDLATSSLNEEIFDVVIICNGQYRKLHTPDIPTLENFGGTVLHSGEYRTRQPFQNQNVLLIGSGQSANDLTCDLRVVVNKMLVVRRRQTDTFDDTARFPNILRISEPLHFTTNGVILDDGQVMPLDTVILCTGYDLDFPFLTPECRVKFNRGRVWPLYHHMINCDYPTMAFIGCILKAIPVLPVVEDQVRYYKVLLDGGFSLPSTEEMKAECEQDYQSRMKKGMSDHKAHVMRPFDLRLLPYLDQLAKEADLIPWTLVMRKIAITCDNSNTVEPCDARNYHFDIINGENFTMKRIQESS